MNHCLSGGNMTAISKTFSFLLKTSLGLCIVISGVFAQYPDRPIKMIVPYPPGGGTDNVARVFAKYLSERIKQPILVENRGGASGMVGSEFVARAVPDGYTMEYTVGDTHSVIPHLFPKVRYDPLKDFIPVVVVGSMPNALVVNTSKVSATSLSEFIQVAKANPGKYSYSTWGVGSGAHIRTEAFNEKTDLKMLHVPYQGSGPSFAAVLGGQVDVTMVPLSMATGHEKGGAVRILGVDTTSRVPDAADVPTFTEQGVPITLAFWQGVLLPAKTPNSIITYLNREANAVLSDPEARAALTKAGVIPRANGMSPKELDTYMQNEYNRWGQVIKTTNIKVD